jgi:hypothetical protein
MNYDTTVGKPFPRVTDIKINYPIAPAMPTLTYNESTCLYDSDGKLHILSSAENTYSILLDLSKARDPIQLVSPSTGVAIEGASTTYTQLMMSLLAIIRHDQMTRDSNIEAARLASIVNPTTDPTTDPTT